MAVGATILSEDYNRIRNKAIAVLGNGGTNPNTQTADPSFGYGQSVASSAVADGTKITKTQWDNLRWDIYNSLYHQTSTVPSLQSVTANSKIQSTVLNYETFANTSISNRFDIGPDEFAVEGGTSSTGATTSRTLSWSNTVSCTVTVAFSNANNARYFFNSGGRIRFSSTFVKSLNNSQNNYWENLLSSIGTQEFSVSNFYGLTSSYTTWYTSPVISSTYSSNRYRLQALVNISNNSNGTASQITFRAQWIDGYTDPGAPAPGDLVQGTLSLTASQRRAVGSLQPFGSPFSISGPQSYSISTIS